MADHRTPAEKQADMIARLAKIPGATYVPRSASSMTMLTTPEQVAHARAMLGLPAKLASPAAPDPLTIRADDHGVTEWFYFVWRGKNDRVLGIVRMNGPVVQQLSYKGVWIEGANDNWHRRLWDCALDSITVDEAEKLSGSHWPGD
jgi:hypothetical protein